MKSRLALMAIILFALAIVLPLSNGNAEMLAIGNPPMSGGYLYNNEVRAISPTQFGILDQGEGHCELDNPLLLIIGVPNVTSWSAPGIKLSSGTGTAGGPSVFGGQWNSKTGYAGSFASGNAYDTIGLGGSGQDDDKEQGGNSSENFNNWHNSDHAVNGINAKYFDLTVYELNNTGIRGGKTVDVAFNAGLPVGSFAIAYGDNWSIFSTPFTQAGLVDDVTEPASVFLLGAGLLACGLFYRKENFFQRTI